MYLLCTQILKLKIMRIDVKFANEHLVLDARDVMIQADWVVIKRLRFSQIQDLDSFEKLIGDFGHGAMEWWNDEDVQISVHKTNCEFHFIANNEERVKYLTEQIDKMSTELNNLINK